MLLVRGAVGRGGPALARLSAGRRVCRKYRKAYIRKLQQQEYDRLRSMVPSLKRRKKRISKIKVIEATIRYIDQLHRALADRLRKDGAATEKDEQVADTSKRSFVQESKSRVWPSGGDIPSHSSSSSSVSIVCEKERRIPSYLLQTEVLSRIGT